MQSCCYCECKLGEIVGEDSLGLTCKQLQRMSASEQRVERSVKKEGKRCEEKEIVIETLTRLEERQE